MPAITADTLTLPRIAGPAHATPNGRSARSPPAPAATRARASRWSAPSPGSVSAALDPFVHMDQMGEVEYQPGQPRGTDWHPHRGFETVTYMIDGRFAHQDSHGGGGLITDGATSG